MTSEVTLGATYLGGGRWRKLLDSQEQRWLGSGSPVPGILDVVETNSLALGPKALLLLAEEDETTSTLC
jgi:hypothetical protein